MWNLEEGKLKGNLDSFWQDPVCPDLGRLHQEWKGGDAISWDPSPQPWGLYSPTLHFSIKNRKEDRL
jgi:hypothetical protein